MTKMSTNGLPHSGSLNGIESFTARDLQEMELPEPSFVVDKLLPEGLSLLVADPKSGKTMLAQNISLAVASGKPAFDTIPVERGPVVFLALEGSLNGMQRRLNRMLDGQTAPEDLLFLRNFPKLDKGGYAALQEIISLRENTKLVVVDTFQRIRGKSSGRANIYEQDYEALAPLADFTTETGVSVLAIHHRNKLQEGPKLGMVSGSTAMTAAVDNILFMERSHTGSARATLTVTAREQEEIELVMSFDSRRAMWRPEGEAWQVAKTEERGDILNVLREADRPLGPKQIAVQLSKSRESVSRLLGKMLDTGVVVKKGYGKYKPAPPPP